MKQGQASHILLYALTAVIASFVLIFGYKAIFAMRGSTDKITVMNFRSDIMRDIDLGSQYGAVKTQKYRVPSGYEEICFVDLSVTPGSTSFACGKNPIVCDSWEARTANVFLLPDGEPFLASNMTFATGNYLCTSIVKGQFEIRMRGKGTNTEIGRV